MFNLLNKPSKNSFSATITNVFEVIFPRDKQISCFEILYNVIKFW